MKSIKKKSALILRSIHFIAEQISEYLQYKYVYEIHFDLICANSLRPSNHMLLCMFHFYIFILLNLWNQLSALISG